MADDKKFGDLLRRHRLAAGLTQSNLAELAGLSLRGLSDIERGLHAAPHRETVLRLADALHLDGIDTAALHEAGRRRGALATVAAPRPTSPSAVLPIPLSRFVGRERELAEVRQRLARTGFLTLTGPGGSGKTRLALQVGSEVTSSFGGGVVFVSLAALGDPELVAPTIAQALGVRDLGGRPLVERLIEYLQDKTVLLVLDNFEHVLPAGPLVGQLLSAASGLKVLVTSREALRVQGEHEFPVPPLALPERNQDLTLEALSHCEAVALFVDRASAIRPDFGVTDNNVQPIVEICRRLDGLPLAIELAAARTRLLSPQELLQRLDNRLSVLTDGARDLPARQRTLRGTIDWSYDLLDAGEQALLRRLSVFVGGCTLEAAAAVAGGEDEESDVLNRVSSLLAKSLLRQQPASTGETRLGMLETIREYGLEQLQVTGELLPMRRRHAAFYLALAEKAEPKLLTDEQVQWVRRLEAEYDNLRAVMTWSRDGIVDGEIGLRLAGALAWFWVLSGVALEAHGWVEAMLALPSGGARTRARARALHAAARIGIVRGDAAAALKSAQESVAIFHELSDKPGGGHALTARASAESIQGDYAAAHATIEQSIRLAQELGDGQVLAHALVRLGNVLEAEGDYQRARRVWEDAAAAARTTGDRHTLGMALAGLAHLARLRGDLEQARGLFQECLALAIELGPFWRVLPRALGGLAGVAALAGDCVRSAHLFGAAESLWRASGKRDMPWWQVVFDADTTAVRAALGEERFAKALAKGGAMRLEEALAYAFDRLVGDTERHSKHDECG